MTLVSSTLAAKPAKEITLTAGPLEDIDKCIVANNTDQTIEVFMNICFALKDNSAPIECFDVFSGDTAPIAGLSIEPENYINSSGQKWLGLLFEE